MCVDLTTSQCISFFGCLAHGDMIPDEPDERHCSIHIYDENIFQKENNFFNHH